MKNLQRELNAKIGFVVKNTSKKLPKSLDFLSRLCYAKDSR